MPDDRIPPQNLIAERSVLGCQILGPEQVEVVREIIGVKDFYSDINGTIQASILAIFDSGGELDLITLAARLESDGKLQEVGGHGYLIELLESVPFAIHAASHAEIVAECSRRRAAIQIAEKLSRDAFDMSKPEADVLALAASSAGSLSEMISATDRNRPKPISQHVFNVIETFERGEVPTVWWGLPAIDEMIGGAMPGEMIVIGARPSHGKSLLGLQWLDEASAKGVPGLIISEEMSATSLATRLLSSLTVIPDSEWRSDTRRVAFDAKQHFENRAPIIVAEKVSTAAGAERCIARAVKSHGIKIVAVDYVQLLSGDGANKEQRVADVSTRMKNCAMKHDIVVLLLAQLNRQIENREAAAAHPQLADLRDSGGIENDADVVLFPFWPWKLNNDYEDRTEYRVYCRKNRNRGIGNPVIQMTINPSRQRLESRTEPDLWDRY